ncbi:MAG: thioredoxin family protein [Ruminococcaceae bacterium]|nr:thioredoxin family protein [Oscillospiraceae bacterium]
MLEITEYNFDEEITQCKAKVFLVFSSARCSFCRDLKQLTAVLQRVLTDVKFCFADVDKERGLAARFGINRLPVSIVFENGKEEARREGAMTKAEVFDVLKIKPETVRR